MTSVPFTEFVKVYRKLPQTQKTHIDSILDNITLFATQQKQFDPPNKTKEEYIESKLYKHMCFLSIYYDIEYDMHSFYIKK